MNRRLPARQMSSTRRTRLKLLVAATSIAAATQLVACGTNPGEATPSSQIAVTGTLLHEEQVGAVRVGWWETPSGVVGIAQGPVDHPEFSRRVVESINQPTLGEAFRAVRALAGRSMELPAVLAAADARHPGAPALAPVDGSLEAGTPARGAETLAAPQSSGGSGAALAQEQSGDFAVAHSALTPAEDDAAVKLWL